MLRGNISPKTILLEVFRLQHRKLRQRRERSEIAKINIAPARLKDEYARLNEADLLEHFRRRTSPQFLFTSDFEELSDAAKSSLDLFPSETNRILQNARRIVDEKRWLLLGFGDLDFKRENFWRLDPIGEIDWGLDYHADLKYAGRGADVRVLWELNRFGHAITLAQSYLITKDESLAEEFFSQIKSWSEQNPYALGANWGCAMEVALRLINLLVAFEVFRHSPLLDAAKLSLILRLFDQHGKFITDNSEFSYISTSNHYLSNTVGLLWLGVLLPELENADEWRKFGLSEMLREMDKQVLADGADYESSTGYQRLVTEMFLYSFLLCRRNNLDIPEKYWKKLRKMLEYIRSYTRPDGFAPLIGDTDSGQILPFVKRAGDDHAYLLAVGAVLFDEANFKILDAIPPEVFWTFGKSGAEKYQTFDLKPTQNSQAFPEAGAYVMREEDLYLHFNASDCGLNGRGSHGHNDKLSIEISAFNRPFVVDPGSYVYTSDLEARHLFRSTAYHSTVQIDDLEQNSINAAIPFVIGNEARPRVLQWETSDARDLLVAEHYGYTHSSVSVVHRRSVEFNKSERFWVIEDLLSGEGDCRIHFRFHLAPNLKVAVNNKKGAVINAASGHKLLIEPFGLDHAPEIDRVWVSRDYGERCESSSLRWTIDVSLPLSVSFAIIPLQTNEGESSISEKLKRISDNLYARRHYN